MCQLMCTLLIELLIHRCQACTGIGNQCLTLCIHKLISLLSTVCIYPITILRILQQSIHIQESILASFIFGLLQHFIIHISTIIQIYRSRSRSSGFNSSFRSLKTLIYKNICPTDDPSVHMISFLIKLWQFHHAMVTFYSIRAVRLILSCNMNVSIQAITPVLLENIRLSVVCSLAALSRPIIFITIDLCSMIANTALSPNVYSLQRQRCQHKENMGTQVLLWTLQMYEE